MKNFKWAKWLWILAPLLLVWALRKAPVAAIGQAITGLSGWKIVLLLLANGVILLLFSARWWFILRGLGFPTPFFRLTSYRVAGFSVSYFTPGTQFGGEPLLVYLLRQRHAIPMQTAISSVFLDKLLELLSNFTFVVVGLCVALLSGLAGGWPRVWMALPVAALLTLPLAHLLALGWGRAPLTTLLNRLASSWTGAGWLRTGADYALHSEKQIAALFRERPQILLYTLLFSGLSWLAVLGEYGLMAFFLGATLSFPQVVIAMTAARLAFLLPLPGGLGALEASQALALQALGFDPALGLALSLLIRARDLLVGGLGLALGGSTFLPGKTRQKFEKENGLSSAFTLRG